MENRTMSDLKEFASVSEVTPVKLKAAPIFNHVWVWMNARIPVSVPCFEWQKVHRTHSTTLCDLLFSVDL